MIAQLRGEVVHRELHRCVVDVGGVGYLVHVADASHLPAIGQPVVLHTSLQVREDSMTLYGFRELAALALFEVLLTSSGVGPKLALAALGTLAPTRLRQAIASGDLATLATIPGVGKKVAQRMVLELKDKVGGVGGDLELADIDTGPVAGPLAAVHEALSGLGYGPQEVRVALRDLDGDDEAVLLRAALRRLAGASA